MLSKCWLAVLFTISWLASLSLADSQSEGAYLYMEPFYWGAATAAYQSEGAANSDGRGPSIWDTFSAIPGKIHNNDNGNIADDSYHKYMEDIELLKSLGVNSYRFSISWSRILPQGTLQHVNIEGIEHYQKVLDALLAANIEPFVTLYHWDLPQALEDAYGGLLDDRFVTDFVAYADLCFKSFGTKVRHWITINEPWTVSYLAYGEGVFAPGRCSDRQRCHLGDTATESYIAAHNLLKAHAAAADWYKKHYQSTQHGLIGITLNQDWSEPFDVSDYEDVAAAERRREFVFGWFGDPLFFGHYPASMVTLVGDRLPSFTPEESTKLMNSVDFLGINHYTTKYILHRHPGGLDANPQLQRLQRQNPRYFNDSILPFLTGLRSNGHEQGWAADHLTIESYYGYNGQVIGPQGGSPWLHSVPEGFYNMLMWVHRRYALFFKPEEVNTWPAGKRRPPFVYITENGCDVLQESQLSFPQVLQDDFRYVLILRGYFDVSQ